MLVIPVFAFGIVNIYFHRAVMEGPEPVFAEMARMIRKVGGRWGSYVLEFLLLVAALWFAREGHVLAAILYGAYTLLNIFGYQILKTLGEP